MTALPSNWINYGEFFWTKPFVFRVGQCHCRFPSTVFSIQRGGDSGGREEASQWVASACVFVYAENKFLPQKIQNFTPKIQASLISKAPHPYALSGYLRGSTGLPHPQSKPQAKLSTYIATGLNSGRGKREECCFLMFPVGYLNLKRFGTFNITKLSMFSFGILQDSYKF